MKCPVCYNPETKVLDSRSASDDLAIRRRRECCKCGFRFSTYEAVELLDLMVRKRSGQREAYSRAKLEKGICRSLEKRSIMDNEIKKLINNIEREIQIEVKKNKNNSEISSQRIGEIAMEQLKRVDQVAYIRFASVYKSFKDAEEFESELAKINKNN
ncbi:transcriptional regulator NrdR [Candidatus Falkowbacteria bacterium RIFOXYD2_FULL_35_9]|uniref:Transcriptional repressor NrdR n=1 Tax=Candidatus Falkowbacteria bacterium RIFOXYC2_FULL_36_12 TaxID=1798002 RepID=A0A1F5SYY4_9BACT|nr:MAG: transcriptional regulator NrdR [Candidatus Falkowbacteria bacterium RIFOXYB2_FULL_35_7]OGF31869.1 MAG: transcriptional regulator NrdR [Candidatus Falkowbacteria bacterium RIFOXYC2_FULL_36_12]OGF33628.1 MAG: transcriptional regulator NrdR [Candidatus Falkowbacteria bacterium RIFOXYA2_FULL_35_8]OGF45826.1 MAG: transcriptional regulator NrdR [Candidatus Falkowbacteria bacterium RIFOXYD2_FULL_35_9]